MASRPARAFAGPGRLRALPPSKERHARCGLRLPTSHQTPCAARRSMQVQWRGPTIRRDVACGQRHAAAIVCGNGRRSTALGSVGRRSPSKGPTPPHGLSHVRGRRVPSSSRPSSTSYRHRPVERQAGSTCRPREPTKTPFPTSSREGRRFPESRGAFYRQESAAWVITPPDREPCALHYAVGPRCDGPTLQAGGNGAFFPTPAAWT